MSALPGTASLSYIQWPVVTAGKRAEGHPRGTPYPASRHTRRSLAQALETEANEARWRYYVPRGVAARPAARERREFGCTNTGT